MPATIPIDIYEILEKNFGREDAHKLTKSFEAVISDAADYKWKVTKDELLADIRKEFITKELFEEKINALRAEMQGMRVELLGEMKKDKTELEAKIENVKVELEAKIENVKVELEAKIETNILGLENKMVLMDRKFTIMFIILFFTIIFLNQNALEFLARILGLIK